MRENEAHVVTLRPTIRRLLGRRSPPRRGALRLVSDVVALERMTDDRRAAARVRLEAKLGRPLLRELERQLDVEGLLAPRRRRRTTRRAA